MEKSHISNRLSEIISFCLGVIVCATVCTFIISKLSKPKYEKIISPIPTNFTIPTKKPIPTETPTPVIEGEYHSVSFYDQSYCDKYSPKCITASGEKFVDSDFTCACANRYSLGTLFKVSYQGRSVVTRCNDRGNFEVIGRTLDLSKASFEALAPLSRGVLQVEIEEL